MHCARARYVHYRAYHYVMMVNELVDDNTVGTTTGGRSCIPFSAGKTLV